MAHLRRQLYPWSLKCSWSIDCRRCSIYICILDSTPCFNGLGKDNCKTRRESFHFWILSRLILETLRYSLENLYLVLYGYGFRLFAAFPTLLARYISSIKSRMLQKWRVFKRSKWREMLRNTVVILNGAIWSSKYSCKSLITGKKL